jgi:hypothetical protein
MIYFNPLNLFCAVGIQQKTFFGVNYGVISTLNIRPKNDFIRTVKQAASQYGDYIKNVFILLPSKGFLMIKACFNQLMIFY